LLLKTRNVPYLLAPSPGEYPQGEGVAGLGAVLHERNNSCVGLKLKEDASPILFLRTTQGQQYRQKHLFRKPSRQQSVTQTFCIVFV
jgi:hypothetical protein